MTNHYAHALTHNFHYYNSQASPLTTLNSQISTQLNSSLNCEPQLKPHKFQTFNIKSSTQNSQSELSNSHHSSLHSLFLVYCLHSSTTPCHNANTLNSQSK